MIYSMAKRQSGQICPENKIDVISFVMTNLETHFVIAALAVGDKIFLLIFKTLFIFLKY